jgi:aspartate kinase
MGVMSMMIPSQPPKIPFSSAQKILMMGGSNINRSKPQKRNIITRA